jgi:murein DD-endopeptidase MepM/ murein hydrolase activator NlpD
MFAMMEKLMTKQMELLQSGKLTPKTTATTADTATTGEAPDLAQAMTSSAAAAPSTTGVKELRQPAALLANQSRAQALAQNGMSTAAAMAPVSTAPITTSAGGHATPYGEPAHGPLTQGYHSRHNGLDVGIVVGTPVHSSMDGKVIYAGWSPIGYGNLVIVQNGDYQTYYAHLSKIPVTAGQTIKAGETIGLSGSTGNSTGPHLHYEIRYQGKNIDPTSLTLNKAI